MASAWEVDPLRIYSQDGSAEQRFRFDEQGEFQCYGEDGETCKPGVPHGDVSSWKPVSCTVLLDARLARTGYETPGHWCNRSIHPVAAGLDAQSAGGGSRRNLAYARVAWDDPPVDANGYPAYSAGPLLPRTGWMKDGDQYYRIERDGYFSCYSEDGKSCTPGEPTLGARDVQPRKCDKKSEYDDPAHWCNTAFANTFAHWKNYAPLGLPFVMAPNQDGRMMCVSADGKSCLHADDPRHEDENANLTYAFCADPKIQQTLGNGWCQSFEIVEEHKIDLDSANLGASVAKYFGDNQLAFGFDNASEHPVQLSLKLGTMGYEPPEVSFDITSPKGIGMARMSRDPDGAVKWMSGLGFGNNHRKLPRFWQGIEIQSLSANPEVGITIFEVRQPRSQFQ
jgi:hypothetical protein